jgi:hypothetical protein
MSVEIRPTTRCLTLRSKTISEWLSDSICSHDIADADALKKDYALNTSHIAKSWPVHSVEATKGAIIARGLGGTLDDTSAQNLVYGWELARTLARQYAGFTSNKMGRGFVFRECVEALKAKGL